MAGNENSGRPPYAPSDEEREKVRVLKAGGMSNEAIAECIGISEPTLRKHFHSELDRGGARVKADVLMARYRSAMGGNVQAQNKLIEQFAAVDAQDRRSPKQPRLGKKEMQKAAAEAVAAGRYAPPTAPKLVVNNK